MFGVSETSLYARLRRKPAHMRPISLVDHLRDLPGRDRDQDAVSYLSRFTIGSVPEEERLELWVDYVRQRGGATDNETLVNLLALMTAAPEYQLC